jgi:hypothetical protein
VYIEDGIYEHKRTTVVAQDIIVRGGRYIVTGDLANTSRITMTGGWMEYTPAPGGSTSSFWFVMGGTLDLSKNRSTVAAFSSIVLGKHGKVLGAIGDSGALLPSLDLSEDYP